MNKTTLFVTFAALAGIGIVGAVVLLITRPDATATLTTLLVTVLALVVNAAGSFNAIEKTNEKIDRVVKQTNGNLSALTDENTRLTNILIDQGIDPVSVAEGRHAKDTP